MGIFIGKIIAMQNPREGVSANGMKWQSCEYVIEDVTHQKEGLIVRAFRDNDIHAVGERYNGQLTVEVEYISYLRHWNGTKNGQPVGEPRWWQEISIKSLKILKGDQSAPAEQEAPAAAEQQQQKQGNEDLPF